MGLPKTIDNDVFPITQTLGLWTATEQGAIFFENIVNENTTSDRQLIIHEIMGRNAVANSCLHMNIEKDYNHLILFLKLELQKKNGMFIQYFYLRKI